MYMLKLSNKHRRIVRRYIDAYVQAPYYPIRGKVEERTRAWANGKTMQQIANEEGVSLTAVAVPIREFAEHVLEFAHDRKQLEADKSQGA